MPTIVVGENSLDKEVPFLKNFTSTVSIGTTQSLKSQSYYNRPPIT